ncbi:chorismate-binding protein, partial [Georgenia sp. 10Sc9-8]|nr:chorismate-binding protein [Georgenia halotolerans]
MPAAEPVAPTRGAARRHLTVRTTEVPDVGDLLAVLPAPSATETFSWLRRGDGIVGWGTALRMSTGGRILDADAAWSRAVTRMDVVDEVREPGTGAVAFGTFPFSPTSAGEGVLVVPEVVVGRREGRSWVTTATWPGTAPRPVADLLRGAAPVTAPGRVRFTDGARSVAGWRQSVGEVVARIRAGEARKVVMARDVVGRSENALDVRHLLGNLAREYPSCWTFSVDRMVGATPELLLRREKGLVACRVLAGTIRRTGDDADDLRTAATLARSSKDLGEHELAVASVVRALRPYCSSMNVPDAPFVLELPNVMHLASDVTGSVAPPSGHPSTWQATAGPGGPSSLALAAALHPTAAVCGTPTAVAARILAEAEQMDRSRYAGPVGWLGSDGDGE